MSSQVWAYQMLRKYKLTVNFDEETIDSPNGFFVTFGYGGEYETFYGALTYMVGRLK